MVGVRGFELLTSCSQSRRAAGLRYTPMMLKSTCALQNLTWAGSARSALLYCVLTAALLAGCSTNKKQMLPHGQNTMVDVWDQGTTGSAGSASGRQLLDARSELRRPIDVRATQPLQDSAAYTRTAPGSCHVRVSAPCGLRSSTSPWLHHCFPSLSACAVRHAWRAG